MHDCIMRSHVSLRFWGRTTRNVKGGGGRLNAEKKSCKANEFEKNFCMMKMRKKIYNIDKGSVNTVVFLVLKKPSIL